LASSSAQIYTTVSSTGGVRPQNLPPTPSQPLPLSGRGQYVAASLKGFQTSPLSFPYQPLRMKDISRTVPLTAEYLSPGVGWGEGPSPSRDGPFNGFTMRKPPSFIPPPLPPGKSGRLAAVYPQGSKRYPTDTGFSAGVTERRPCYFKNTGDVDLNTIQRMVIVGSWVTGLIQCREIPSRQLRLFTPVS
jgi:hypothetical protein